MAAQAGDPKLWTTGGRSVVGASHIRYGIPNQDAIAWSPRNDSGSAPSAVLALADGHGASVHFRSAIGAHMAVEAAVRVLTEALGGPLPFPRGTANASAIFQAIVDDWRGQVAAHVAANPFDREIPASRGYDAFTPYGTTLIAAAAGPGGILLLQIGDGDLLLATSDGEIRRPLPDDVGLVGEQTYSLCQADAVSLARTRWIAAADLSVDFIMLSTDGLAKSFADEDAFRNVATFWRRHIEREGLAAAINDLSLRLSEISREGSGDDITLGFLVAEDLNSNVGAGGEEERDPAPIPPVSPRQPKTGAPPRNSRLFRAGGLTAMALLSAVAAAAIAAAAYVLLVS